MKCINLKFDSLYYLCDITEDFSNNKLSYSCNSSYNNLQLNIFGDFDYSSSLLNCYNRNDEIDEDITSDYCDKVYDQIQTFIEERNKLLSNSKFKKAISK